MNPFDIDKYISEQLHSSMGVLPSALQSTATSFNAQSLQKLIDSLPKPKVYFYPDNIKEKLESGLGINLDEKDVTYGMNRYVRTNYVEDIYVFDSDALDMNKWKYNFNKLNIHEELSYE